MNTDPLKRKLSQYARKISQDRLTMGSSGNLSAIKGRNICIKVSNRSFENAVPQDFVYINIKNPDIKGKDNRPSCEYRLHIACYNARPDIKAVFHTHPLFATILYPAIATHKALTLEFALYIKRPIAIVDCMPPGSIKLAHAVAGQAYSNDIIVVRQHGIITLGSSMQEAYLKALIIEREAKAAVLYKIIRKKPAYLTKEQISALSMA
jgi:L-fuculose-phosphate aldolase